MRRPERQRAGDSGRRRGLRAFTLVELLVVISIILVLIGILMPTITNAIKESYAANTLSYIEKNLIIGADSYKHDRGYYPGQDTETRKLLDDGTYTGSQILAACLFQYADADPPDDDKDPWHYIDRTDITDPDTYPSPDPKRAYASYKKEYLADVRVKKPDGTYASDPIPNSLADGFPGSKVMAILYYPAHRNIQNPMEQFRYTDNKAYMLCSEVSTIYHANDTVAQSNLKLEILDPSASAANSPDRPYNCGAYLLVGAGVDRRYFSTARDSDDEVVSYDDVTNY